METKVTVVIPVYNTKAYLKDCVDSITAQTFQNLEILLVDDGSTDGSSAVCDELSNKDTRIRVIHKRNGGVASARNLGIDEAKGKYIMFADSDDWLDLDAIETLVRCADEHELDVVKFNYVREFDGKQLVKKNTFLEERIYADHECLNICRQTLGLTGKELVHPENMNFLASCCTNVYRKKLLISCNIRFVDIWEIGSFEDGLFNFSTFFHMRKFAYIDKAFYHYRKSNETSETAGYRKDYINKRLNLARMVKNKTEEVNKWDFFSEAYNNRMVHATMEIAFNAMRNKASRLERYKEIRYVLHHPQFVEAYKSFSLDNLSLKWKVYFFFITHSMALPTYLMTAIILKLKNRGVR